MQKVVYVAAEDVRQVNSILEMDVNAKVVNIVPVFDPHSVNAQGVRPGFGAYVVLDLDD